MALYQLTQTCSLSWCSISPSTAGRGFRTQTLGTRMGMGGKGGVGAKAQPLLTSGSFGFRAQSLLRRHVCVWAVWARPQWLCLPGPSQDGSPVQLTHQARSAITCQGHSPSLHSLPPTIRTRLPPSSSGLGSVLLKSSRWKGSLVGCRSLGSYCSCMSVSGGSLLLWEAWAADLFLRPSVSFPHGKGSERKTTKTGVGL